MSGSNSSAPVSTVPPPDASPLALTVHSMPPPQLEAPGRRTAHGRFKMLAVLAVCMAPVIASYVTYFFIKPQGRTNYAELITPPRALPADLPLHALSGAAVSPASLHGQWLLVVVADGACDRRCESHLLLQRQLRETLGREKDRVDKLWLITDDAPPRPAVMQGIGATENATDGATTVLRVAPAALSRWLAPAAGHALSDHIYLVDPMGQWMMRTPPSPQPAALKRDIERLLRASASWDLPGR